jgi:hypothetical protein
MHREGPWSPVAVSRKTGSKQAVGRLQDPRLVRAREEAARFRREELLVPDRPAAGQLLHAVCDLGRATGADGAELDDERKVDLLPGEAGIDERLSDFGLTQLLIYDESDPQSDQVERHGPAAGTDCEVQVLTIELLPQPDGLNCFGFRGRRSPTGGTFRHATRRQSRAPGRAACRYRQRGHAYGPS